LHRQRVEAAEQSIVNGGIVGNAGTGSRDRITGYRENSNVEVVEENGRGNGR